MDYSKLKPNLATVNQLYQQIVPEKPNILAEERIFVYVPKVMYDSAGIAKFATDQFNIVDGRVSLKSSYLAEVLEEVLEDGTVVVKKAEQDASGNVITSTYETKIDATSKKSEIDGRLDTAISEIDKIKDGTTIVKKAEQDASGNVITSTYETKAVVSGISTLISSLDLSKLNKEFTSLIEEVSLSLSDVFVVDKGSGARKVSLGTIASYLSTQESPLFTIVEELPMENQNPNTIYLLTTENEEGQNQLLEYIWIANQERWELIGSLEVDLSDYYTKTEANELFNNKVEEALNDGKTYARKNKGWVELQSGFLPDEETITLNGNDELEATNVAIWRYE